MDGYFACSIADVHDVEKVRELITSIENLGHKILNRHVAGKDYTEKEKIFCARAGLSRAHDFNPVNVMMQDLNWVMECQFMVCDVTHGSWGGGIELAHATAMRNVLDLTPIPILCICYKEKMGSWLVLGLASLIKPVIDFDWYEPMSRAVDFAFYHSIEDAKDIIKKFLDGVEEKYEGSNSA